MTREEAIADIRDNIKPVVGGISLDMAIEALEQQTCEEGKRMKDYLIKEDVLMALTGDITDCTIEEFIARLRDKLSKLPSVVPKEKIIHCKDCKYRDYWGDCNKWSKELDAHKSYTLDENMFCGFAERK